MIADCSNIDMLPYSDIKNEEEFPQAIVNQCHRTGFGGILQDYLKIYDLQTYEKNGNSTSSTADCPAIVTHAPTTTTSPQPSNAPTTDGPTTAPTTDLTTPPPSTSVATTSSTRPDWPFGPHYATLEDVLPMTSFKMSCRMMDAGKRQPTPSEINAMICKLNEYFTVKLRRKELNPCIHTRAIYIDWVFNKQRLDEEDILVSFTSFSFYQIGDDLQLPAADVFEAMKLSPADLNTLMQDYVRKASPEGENVFFHTEQLFLQAEMGNPLEHAPMLIEAEGCVDPAQSAAIAAAGGIDDGDRYPGMGSNIMAADILVAFRVSNMEGITDPAVIKAQGLDTSFPVFVNEVATEFARKHGQTRSLSFDGRRLRVVPVVETARVESVEELFPCPPTSLFGLTCHSVSAKYVVLVRSNAVVTEVQNEYTEAFQIAIDDGTFNKVLLRVDPNTTLYIGIMANSDHIPPASAHNMYVDKEEGEPPRRPNDGDINSGGKGEEEQKDEPTVPGNNTSAEGTAMTMSMLPFDFSGILNPQMTANECPLEWEIMTMCIAEECPEFTTACPTNEQLWNGGVVNTVVQGGNQNSDRTYSLGGRQGNGVEGGLMICTSLDNAICSEFSVDEGCCLSACALEFRLLFLSHYKVSILDGDKENLLQCGGPLQCNAGASTTPALLQEHERSTWVNPVPVSEVLVSAAPPHSEAVRLPFLLLVSGLMLFRC